MLRNQSIEWIPSTAGFFRNRFTLVWKKIRNLRNNHSFSWSGFPKKIVREVVVNYLWIEGTLAWSGFKNKIIKLSWTEVPFAGNNFGVKEKWVFFQHLYIYIHLYIQIIQMLTHLKTDEWVKLLQNPLNLSLPFFFRYFEHSGAYLL